MKKHVLYLVFMENKGLVLDMNEALSATIHNDFIQFLEALEKRNHSNEDSASVIVCFTDRKNFLENGRFRVD